MGCKIWRSAPRNRGQLGHDHMNEPRVVLFTQSGHVEIASCAHKRVFHSRHVVRCLYFTHFCGFEKHALASLAPAALALDAADF